MRYINKRKSDKYILRKLKRKGVSKKRFFVKIEKNFFKCVPAEFKFLALIKFLKSQHNEKILVFCSNSAQCEYFGIIVRSLLEDDERVVMEMHRKMEGKRQKVVRKIFLTG